MNAENVDPLDAYMNSLEADVPFQEPALQLVHTIADYRQNVLKSRERQLQAAKLDGLYPPLSVTARNRRYAAAKSLLQTDFFSDDEMERRAPRVFHEILGSKIEKHIVDESYAEYDRFMDSSRPTMSGNAVGSEHGEIDTAAAEMPRVGLGIHAYSGEIFDLKPQSSSGLLTSMLTSATQRHILLHPESEPSSNHHKVDTAFNDAETIEEARKYLVTVMVERFIAGHDSDFFDYSTVDDDVTLDAHIEALDDASSLYFSEG